MDKSEVRSEKFRNLFSIPLAGTLSQVEGAEPRTQNPEPGTLNPEPGTFL
jgi:hypothetical protein